VPTLQFSLTVAAAASLPTPPPPCHSPGRRCRLLTWPPEPPPPPRSAARCCLIARPPPRHLAVGAALPGRRLLLGQPFGTTSLPGHRRPSIYEPMCQIRVPAPRPSIFVKDRRSDQRGGEWEPIKIPHQNLAYVPKSTRNRSLLTRSRASSYRQAIGLHCPATDAPVYMSLCVKSVSRPRAPVYSSSPTNVTSYIYSLVPHQ
jgi:hypothetical protein